tara:strand:- start:3376 stop:4437 length:1062 start_codon:yes stop_codon:yes gene_type:complete
MTEFYEQFNYQRYADSLMQSPGEQALANGGQRVSFTRIASDENKDMTIHFKSFITNYNETYMCEWKSEKVYGRADPIPMFVGTRRKITLGLAIPAVSAGDGYENLAKVQKLIQFLYPSYRDKINDTSRSPQESFSQIITRSPLIRLQFMNMIQDCTYAGSSGPPARAAANSGDEEAGDCAYIYDAYEMQQEGLLGVVTNFIVLHHMGDESGVIEKTNTVVIGEATKSELNAIMPKLIEINFDFEPIHEHPLGWSTEGVFGVGHRNSDSSGHRQAWDQAIWYPYGIYLKTDESDEDEDSALFDALSEADDGGSGSLVDDQGSTAEGIAAVDTEDGDNTALDDANQAVLNNIGFA